MMEDQLEMNRAVVRGRKKVPETESQQGASRVLA
jgi:hypothetical protein